MRDLIAGDRSGYLTLFYETGSGLTNAGHIMANGVDIQVNANSFPFINDWNEDGLNDLIMGEQSPVSPNTGNIRVYLNEGTNESPSFGGYSVLYAGGSQIYWYRVNPVVYDLEQDGLKDLIIGNDDGRIYLYKNVGTNANPVFSVAYDTLKTENGTVIDASAGSRIHFVDWTGDGDLDLLVSGSDGYVMLYENTALGIQGDAIDNHIVKDLTITPNPITKSATIKYSLNKRGHVRVDVYSSDGRLLATPLKQFVENGHHRFNWDVSDNNGEQLPAGIYFVRLSAGSEIKTARVVIMH